MRSVLPGLVPSHALPAQIFILTTSDPGFEQMHPKFPTSHSPSNAAALLRAASERPPREKEEMSSRPGESECPAREDSLAKDGTWREFLHDVFQFIGDADASA